MGTMPAAELDTMPRLLAAAAALSAEASTEFSEAERRIVESNNLPFISAQVRCSLIEAIESGHDPLGEAFCQIFSAEERRKSGAIYTPGPIVGSMVSWAKGGPEPVRIIDPGSGSARFAIAAGEVFPNAEIVAVELNPVAALISRANLLIRGLRDRSNVHVTDYRHFIPPRIEGVSLYIGNPPYVRHHSIEKKWKNWLTATAARNGFKGSQLAGLHVYFFLATAQGASEGDRGTFITSSEWLDVNYGSLVRDLLLDKLGGESIHVIDPSIKPFDNAQTTGAITCFEVGAKPRSLRLSRVRALEDLSDLSKGQRVRRERLVEAPRWTPLLRGAKKAPHGHIELGELCKVHRGAVTGANRVWITDGSATDLPGVVLFPAVTRARELFHAGEELGCVKSLRSVVDLPQDLDLLEEDDRRAVEKFIRNARRQGAHRSYIAKHRPTWWSVGLREAAPILTTYMARQSPAVVRNLAQARHINIAHGLYPREPLTSRQLDHLTQAIREVISGQLGRTYSGGLMKFEPGELSRLHVPNVLLQATP